MHQELQGLAGASRNPALDREMIFQALVIGNLVVANEEWKNPLFESGFQQPLAPSIDDPISVWIYGMAADLVADAALAEAPATDQQEETGELVGIVQDVLLV